MLETFQSLVLGFSVALSPGVLWYGFIGCVVGTLVGVLPGVGPLAGISLLLPATFPTALNARSILADKAIIALLSLAATLPMMAGRIDLTIGFGIVYREW